MGGDRRRRRRAHQCRAGRGRTYRGGRHDVLAHAGKCRERDGRDFALPGRDGYLHHAGLPLQDRGRPPDEFPSAAFDACHARLRLHGHRCDESRLSGGGRTALSLLFLWRCLPSDAGAGMKKFRFELAATDRAARTGTIHTPRGEIRTPAFMPVGTAGSVKAMLPESVRETGADIILGNTYHLMLRPGAERVAELGGLHRFMGWERPILTDSGGFQVMSLAKLRKISEEGVAFRSHIDGSEQFLSPEPAMEIQRLLGSDIQMVLDECPAFPASEDAIEKSLALSLRWAKRSKVAFGAQPGRACFGIVQGGVFAHLRQRAARELIEIGFDG